MLIDNGGRLAGGQRFWIYFVSPGVLIFCCVARLHKTLTMNQLRIGNFIVVNGYPMCLRNEEITTHLLIHCSFANKVWASIISIFDVN